MQSDFLKQIIARKAKVELVPSNEVISDWALELLALIYPERKPQTAMSVEELDKSFEALETVLVAILKGTNACDSNHVEQIAKVFFERLPELYRVLNTDLNALLDGDPASNNEFEIIRCYPGFLAIYFYRIAHQLYLANVPLIPRILTEYAHSVTGIDIHPGATIGEYLYIDHGTGIVIGETTHIGKNVKLYQGVTLGALSVEKVFANTKRHPTIGDNVVIYAGATILGGDTHIGDDCIIGGNVWITKSLPAGSTAYHQPVVKITETRKES